MLIQMKENKGRTPSWYCAYDENDNFIDLGTRNYIAMLFGITPQEVTSRAASFKRKIAIRGELPTELKRQVSFHRIEG